ncbi:MAG: HigA family addiction module antidote protein [Puniceicoccales bacterium]|jgi:addiction module HigA family antidote|nr:HigA family addiction module antidote protein [Puniceicoccales bacterium]
MTNPKDIVPTHPGIVLYEEFLKPYGITAAEITKATGIPSSRLSEIFAGRRSISADTAIRISKFLNLNPQSFINLQSGYDRIMAEIAFENQRPKLKIKPSPKLKLALASS